jgi:putative transposase
MARRARLVIPGVPLHIIQRGHNRHGCFMADRDYRVYLSMLRVCAADAGCAVHAYVLMTNHVHLLITPCNSDSAGKLMKALGQRYVQYINRHHLRTGTLWEGRFRSCIVDEERYYLTCQRYIELNPVRAEMVKHPRLYPWSSYRANAEGLENSLVTPHPLYLRLALRDVDRYRAYRELFQDALPSETVELLRRATNGNYALGDVAFVKQAADVLARHVEPLRAGRPRVW